LEVLTSLKAIGVSGYSKVHKGKLDDEEVAIKELKDKHDDRVLHEFRHEVSIQGILDNPYILMMKGSSPMS